VTGASRGLGRWFAVDLAASGADLMLVARSAEGLAGTAELATAQGARCETMRGDVCDDDLARDVVSATCERLGDVDLLVNNAGIGTPALVSDQDIDEWWHVATVNLRAPVMWTMAVLPGMRRRGSGRIINVSSPAAQHSPLPYYSSYTASKAGLSQFTAAFAQEVAAEGICVLAFGPVGLTDMTVSTYENDVLPAAMKDAFRTAFTTEPDRQQQLTMALFRLMVRGGADHLSGGYLGAGEPMYEDASLAASLPATDAGLKLLAGREKLTSLT
jgi:short-subunit dehydrogenase